MKDKIEVGMLSPLMAEFIPDYSDIVNLDDAEPLEGPDLVQYQTSIAEKVDEINRLGMPDNQPCNLIDYFDQNKDIKEKVERITMAVKESKPVRSAPLHSEGSRTSCRGKCRDCPWQLLQRAAWYQYPFRLLPHPPDERSRPE